MKCTPHKKIIPFIMFWMLFSEMSFAGLPVYVDGEALPSLAPMLERSMPAVVNISTTKNVQLRDNPLLRDPFFRHFFQLPQQQKRQQRNSLGSGVIINSKKGYVITNNHVIDKADNIMVTLSDGRQLNATLLGTDPKADVAVIQISADNLTELPIANSNDLKVGDFAVAIGN
ncbi:MAG: trypsin-like peptidase domain-containing protein, partial [Methylococcales bacterium]|nr:trypsin-like peptidase domain-containing protein [Methylococcales bacterium]